MKNLFALVDCNNFYVSCERLFRPELTGKPVIVLSNNDGCIIARSNEVKAMGIPMGAPYFKNEAFIKKNNIKVFSSNYALYGDISQRVMNVLGEMEQDVEIYSIDEAFISLPASDNFDLSTHLAAIRETIKKHVGIPVSIGTAPTKTLAKIANRIAKKKPDHNGVFILDPHQDMTNILTAVDVNDVWGIGRRSAEKLNRVGIKNARQLKDADHDWIRKNLTITGLRTVMELNGEPCIPIEKNYPSKKSIVCSRSFRHTVSSYADLREAVATYVSIAAQKLREQGSAASLLQLFIHTNRFRENSPQYSKNIAISLPYATSSTPVLIKHATQGLKSIFKKQYQYQKAGVILSGLTPDNCQQLDLFQANDNQADLMSAVDSINQKWGRNTLQFAAAGLHKPWSMKQSQKSPAYTTNWQEIPVVKASFPDLEI